VTEKSMRQVSVTEPTQMGCTEPTQMGSTDPAQMGCTEASKVASAKCSNVAANTSHLGSAGAAAHLAAEAAKTSHPSAAEASKASHVAAAATTEAATTTVAATPTTASPRPSIGGTQTSSEGSSHQDDHHLTYHRYTPSQSTIVKTVVELFMTVSFDCEIHRSYRWHMGPR
jgi:hypothetical protein